MKGVYPLMRYFIFVCAILAGCSDDCASCNNDEGDASQTDSAVIAYDGSIDAKPPDAIDASPPDALLPSLDAPSACPTVDAGQGICGHNCEPCCMGDAGYFCLEGGCDSIGGPENRVCLL